MHIKPVFADASSLTKAVNLLKSEMAFMVNHIITSVPPNPQVEGTIKLVFTHHFFETFTGVDSLSALYIFNHVMAGLLRQGRKSSTFKLLLIQSVG